MVSSGRKALWQPFKQSLAVVKNLACFPVHERRGSNDLASEYFTDGLMAEANTEYRNRFMKAPDNIFGYSRIRRCARARRNDNARRFQALYFFQCDLVIPEYVQFFAKLAQVLHQVIGERVVIIDNENHISSCCALYFKPALRKVDRVYERP